MSDNPLDTTGVLFDFAGLNPNPTFSKTKEGPVYRVSFEVTQDLWQLFVDGKTQGLIVAGKLFRTDDGGTPEKQEPVEKGEFGEQAQTLYRNGFFLNPHVLEKLGTDEDYQIWTRKRPCIISDQNDWVDGEALCEYAHVRRADNSGKGTKPPFSGVPMTHEMHKLQHDKGETAAYEKHIEIRTGKPPQAKVTVEQAKEFFNKKANNNLYLWARSRMLDIFDTDSMTKIHPRALWAWCKDRGIDKYLPNVYKEASSEKH